MERFDHGGDIYGMNNIRHDFSVSCNPLGIPDPVMDSLKSHTDEYSRYPDPRCRELRNALSKHHGISAEMILCGNGSADIIFRICAALRPEKALITAPSFSDYERCVRIWGGYVSEYRLSPADDFDIDSGIIDSITEDTDILFLCTPNNPTGRLINLSILQAAADRCEETGTYLVLDECFLPFTDGESMISELPDHPHMIILRAFTKIFSMAGLRLGYAIGDSELLSMITPFGAEWSVSVPAQIAGVKALKLWPEWIAKTRRYVLMERRYMIGRLTDAGVSVIPPDANYILLRNQRPLYGPLLKRGILVRDCSNFTGLDMHYVRIGLLDHKSNSELADAIKEINNAKS